MDSWHQAKGGIEMAQRRMFDIDFVDADAFLDMPATSQLLYFHLGLRADDDGFIHNPKRVLRSCRCTEDDLKMLITKKYLIPFESGIVVIKHWKLHNKIPKDRYKETNYQDEKAMLSLNDNESYTLCIQDVNNMYSQVRVGKERQGEYRLVEGSGNDNTDNHEKNVETVENSRLEFMGGTLGKGVVLLTEEQSNALLEKLGLDLYNYYVEKLANFIIDKKAKVGNHYQTILKWNLEDSLVKEMKG
jgi:hypothetical protein